MVGKREASDVVTAEMALDTLRQAVIADMSSAPIHPVQVGRSNLCEPPKTGKLNGLKPDELKPICRRLHLTDKGSERRTKSFIEPLQAYITKYQCA